MKEKLYMWITVWKTFILGNVFESEKLKEILFMCNYNRDCIPYLENSGLTREVKKNKKTKRQNKTKTCRKRLSSFIQVFLML